MDQRNQVRIEGERRALHSDELARVVALLVEERHRTRPAAEEPAATGETQPDDRAGAA